MLQPQALFGGLRRIGCLVSGRLRIKQRYALQLLVSLLTAWYFL